MTSRENKSHGLGDTLARIIDVLTFGKFRDCQKCKRRRDRLNRAVPYKAK